MGRTATSIRRWRLAPVFVIALWVLSQTLPAGAAAPSIRIIPRSAGSGDTVSVIGIDFCGSEGCSRVTLRIGSRVAASDIAVAGDGTFNTPLQIRETEGEHEVTAVQTGPNGEMAASATLVVAVIDFPGPERPAQDYTATTSPTTAPRQVASASSSGSPAGSEAKAVPATPPGSSSSSTAPAAGSQPAGSSAAPAAVPAPGPAGETAATATPLVQASSEPAKPAEINGLGASSDGAAGGTSFPWLAVTVTAAALALGIAVRFWARRIRSSASR